MAASFIAPVPSTTPRADETPEALADRLERLGRWPLLALGGRLRCQEALEAQRDVAESLARQGLRSESLEDRRYALRVIGALKAVGLFDEVAAALRDPDPVSAAYAIRDLDDPRAIPLLVERFADQPTRFFEILRTLQRHRPAHVSLLALFGSHEAKVRWQTAYSLAESGDPALVPIIQRLGRDPVADVRRQAGLMAFSLDQADYLRAYPSVMRLLSDSDIDVRSEVAWGMAERRDPACAPALRQLVSEETNLGDARHSNTVQAIRTLTGTYFGLTPGTPSPAAVRRKALTEFATWIREHPVDAR